MTDPDGKRSSMRMVDRLTDAFFAVDADSRFTYLNERAEELFAGTRENLLGRVMWDELPAALEPTLAEELYRAMNEDTPTTFELYHDPLETWFEVRACPGPGGLSVYVRDVTDRREHERELIQHAAVVEAVQDGVLTLDEDNRVTSINTALEQSLGVARDAVVGEHVETILDRAAIDPEHAVEVGHAINEIDVGNASHRELEVTFTDAEGDERIGEIRMVAIDEGAAKLAAVIRDVTDRREHERIVTSLHEVTRWLLQTDDPEEICAIAVHAGSDLLSLPISGVWLLDEERGYLDPVAGTAGAHDEFGGLPRFTQGEGLVWDVFESGDAELFDDVRDVEGVYNPETPIRSEIIAPIGTYGVLMTGSTDANRFDETDLELLSALVENTRAALERADRERILRERTERLERQTERLESVATVLSEDLTRELAALSEALEVDSRVSEWEFPLEEESVSGTLDRAERLINDVREFARNSAGVSARTRIDLESAIQTAVHASRIEEANVIVEDQATLRADPDRFSNMLETIFNDAHARAEADLTVQVGLLGVDSPGTDPSERGFFVLDDASEIPPAAHEQVLDPVADVVGRFDGLGLAVARSIAEAHDWSVSISNGENGGTRFAVTDVTTLEPR